MKAALRTLIGLGLLGCAWAASPSARSGFASIPERGDAIATADDDDDENDDSIVAEADSAARAALSAAAAAAGAAEAGEGDGDEGEAKPALWLETYGEGVYSEQEDDNLAGFADWKVGKRLPGPLQADVYAKFRFYRDQREFFWNNRAEGGIGLRVPILRKFSVTAFAEATWGRYLSLASGAQSLEGAQARLDAAQRNFQAIYKAVFQANVLEDPAFDRETLKNLDTLGDAQLAALVRASDQIDSLRAVQDSIGRVPAGPVTEYKLGLVFWHGWGGAPEAAGRPGSSAWFAFPFRPWGEVYADCIGSALERHVRTRPESGGDHADSVVHIRNLILYANPSVGYLVMEGKAGSLAAFAGAYAWFDTHRDWWNNRAMAGPGLRYQPFRDIDLSIKAEYLWGRYYGRERGDDPNPYAPGFTDTRVTASFWHGLGL